MSNSTNQLNQRISNLYGRIGQITSGGGGGVPTSSGLNDVLDNGNTASNNIALTISGTISSVSAGSISVSSGGYNYIFFTNTAATSTLTATIGSTIDYIIIGGGGGGGSNHSGGGGAGGVVVGSTTLTSTSNIISIGAGGGGSNTGLLPTNGGNTTAFGITAGGGGAGGTGGNIATIDNRYGARGRINNGSGGGGSASNTPTSGEFGGGAGVGNGFAGGAGKLVPGLVAGSGGGGGGAGGAGADGQTGITTAPPAQGGVGGAGITSTIIAAFLAAAQISTIANAFKTATSTGQIAGGGGGGSWATTNGSAGGAGGGGIGNNGLTIPAGVGIANTGSGGGGGGSSSGLGAAGGSGIVMVRILTTPTITITDGTLTNVINPNGYSTRNADSQSLTHYLNVSDSFSSGVGAIQKTRNITATPSTGTISLNNSSVVGGTNVITLSNATQGNPTITLTDGTTTNIITNTGGLANLVTTAPANDDTTCYIPFQKSTAGRNLLYVDDNSTFGPLSYNPFTSTLTSNTFTPNSGSASNLSGGVSVTTGGFKYFVFTSGTSNLVVSAGGSPINIDYLMVGGGGGGGGTHAGGGGAGGVVVGSTTLSAGSYSITIGNGGAKALIGAVGSNGNPTTFDIGGGTILTAGGGGGGGGGGASPAANKNGQNGGVSNGNGGGGSCVALVEGTAGIGAATFGYNGGKGVFSSDGSNGGGGGGGGAGQVGAAPASGQTAGQNPDVKGGAGGNGAGASINPLIPVLLGGAVDAMGGIGGTWGVATGGATIIAGGGGGGSWGSTTGVAVGGSGGGGNGAIGLANVETSLGGAVNTGSGGGGGGSGGNLAIYQQGGDGGSGIVIIRAPVNALITTTFSNNNLSFNGSSLTMKLKGLPTSNIGLVEGQVWRNSLTNVLNIVPPFGVLNLISSTGQANMLGTGSLSAGAYGVLRLNCYYNGPIITIKAGETGTPTDFYATSSTQIGTLQTASGLSLISCLNANNVSTINGGIVTKWWDQTGNGKDAISTGSGTDIIRYLTASNTLSFTRTSDNVTGYFTLPNGAFPYGSSGYSYLFTPINQTIYRQSIFAGGAAPTANQSVGGIINDGTPVGKKYENTWTSLGVNSQYVENADAPAFLNGIKVADCLNPLNNRRNIYFGGVSQTLLGSNPSAPRNQSNLNNYIGRTDLTANFVRNYSGELKYFCWAPTLLSVSDINIIQTISDIY